MYQSYEKKLRFLPYFFLFPSYLTTLLVTRKAVDVFEKQCFI